MKAGSDDDDDDDDRGKVEYETEKWKVLVRRFVATYCQPYALPCSHSSNKIAPSALCWQILCLPPRPRMKKYRDMKQWHGDSFSYQALWIAGSCPTLSSRVPLPPTQVSLSLVVKRERLLVHRVEILLLVVTWQTGSAGWTYGICRKNDNRLKRQAGGRNGTDQT